MVDEENPGKRTRPAQYESHIVRVSLPLIEAARWQGVDGELKARLRPFSSFALLLFPDVVLTHFSPDFIPPRLYVSCILSRLKNTLLYISSTISFRTLFLLSMQE